MEDLARLLAESADHLDQEDADNALSKATAALELGRQVRDSAGVAGAVRRAAQALSHLGRRDEAEILVAAELAKFKQAGDTRGEATMALALAEIRARGCGSDKWDEALESARSAFELFAKVRDARGLAAEALLVQLNVHVRRGDSRQGEAQRCYRLALEAGKEALEIFQAEADDRGQAMALHGIAAARVNCGHFDGALRTAKDALRLWQDSGNRRSEVVELQSIATWATQAGLPQQALPFAQEALEVIREEQMGPLWEASALQVLVQALCSTGQQARAARLAADVAAGFQQAGATAAKALALKTHFAAILSRGCSWEALQAAKQAREACAGVGDHFGEAALARQVAQLSLQLHRYDDAFEAAKESLKVCQNFEGYSDERLDCLRTLGAVQVANQKIQDALEVADEERDFYSGEDDKRGEAITLLTTAALHLESTGAQEATWAIEDALELFSEANDKNGEGAATQLLAQVHMTSKEYDLAIETAEKAVPLLQAAGNLRAQLGTVMLAAQAHELKLAAGKLDPTSAKFRQGALLAVQAARDALALARRLADPALVGAAQCLLSRLCAAAVKGPEAVQAGQAAAAALKEAGDRQGEAYALVLAANASVMVGQLPAAHELASRALLLYRHLGDTSGEELASCALDEVDAADQLREEDAQAATAPPAPARQTIKEPTPALAAPAGVDSDAVLDKVKAIVTDIIGLDDIGNDTPLMQAGLTSNAAVLLRNKLTNDMNDKGLPFTLMFDFPSVAALSDYFVMKM